MRNINLSKHKDLEKMTSIDHILKHDPIKLSKEQVLLYTIVLNSEYDNPEITKKVKEKIKKFKIEMKKILIIEKLNTEGDI